MQIRAQASGLNPFQDELAQVRGLLSRVATEREKALQHATNELNNQRVQIINLHSLRTEDVKSGILQVELLRQTAKKAPNEAEAAHGCMAFMRRGFTA